MAGSMVYSFTLVLIILVCIHHGRIMLQASAQVDGFLSIDCGGASSDTYTDSHGIKWMSDSSIITGGLTMEVEPPAAYGGQTPFTSVRYFSGNQTKYCYVLTGMTQNLFYLMRAGFWAGGAADIFNYTADFKLLIDADEWSDVSFPLPQQGDAPLFKEIYVMAQSSSFSVCLAGTGIGLHTPFISSLEVRPLPLNLTAVKMMSRTGCALHKDYRIDYGARWNTPIRYGNDSLDRMWDGDASAGPTLSTQANVNVNGIPDLPPMMVMQTALLSGGSTQSLNIDLAVMEGNHNYHYSLYFAEISPEVTGADQRVFDVLLNGATEGNSTTHVDLFALANSKNTREIYSTAPLEALSGYVNITLEPTSNSTYGPLISALELLRLSDNPTSSGTFSEDSLALEMVIQSTLVGLSTWMGDPCLPYPYNWVHCNAETPPRINIISLSNYKLVGQIPSSINNLTSLLQIWLDGNNLSGPIPDLSALQSLQILNLSNNQLTGSIPNYLSDLPRLRSLSLRNNNLSGEIPKELLIKMQDPSFEFQYEGNPLLCTANNSSCLTTSTASHSKSHISIGLMVGLIFLAIFILIAFGGCFVAKRRRVKKHAAKGLPHLKDRVIGETEVAAAFNAIQAYTYTDIEAASNYFSEELGKGGFGNVYKGKLPTGVTAAIKVSSDNSSQGPKEFLNEVGLLSQVHHKNLVKLLGYCVEQKLVLIYEYMSKGSLKDALYGTSSINGPLSWRARLRIILDAAQGLEYLHHGCCPAIIHRDVKSSNILLDDKLGGKIADFGISKFKAKDLHNNATTITMESGISGMKAKERYSYVSTAVRGTEGYLDPEYRQTLMLTEKADVYSFGVVILETVCGRPPIVSQGFTYIVDWVQTLLEQEKGQEVFDTSLRGDYNVSSIWKVLEIGMKCVNFHTSSRPDMHEVCEELKGALHIEFSMAHL